MAIALAARRKVMIAAGQVETTNPREAAILGGIVRCAIETGGYNAERIRQYTHNIIGQMKLVGVDRRLPGNAEIAMVKERFEEHYGRRFTA